MTTPHNPYQTPAAEVDDVADSTDPQAESIRKEHLNHEASIRAVGALYYLSTLGILAAGLIPFFTGPSPDEDRVTLFITGVLLLAMAAGFFMVARGLRNLRPWTRIPTVLLSVLGLLGFPVGTLINGYIIWLILSKKGRLVLSPEYAAIVAATPHIKYRTSIVIWILLGLIVLGIAAAVFIPIFAK